MSSFSKFICVLSIGLFAFGASVRAEASPPSFGIFGLFGIFSSPKSQLQLVDAETVIAPFAFYQFCAKNAD